MDETALIEEILKVAKEAGISFNNVMHQVIERPLPEVLEEFQMILADKDKPKKPFKWDQ